MRGPSFRGCGLGAYSVKAVLQVMKVGDDAPSGKSGHAPSAKKEARSFKPKGAGEFVTLATENLVSKECHELANMGLVRLCDREWAAVGRGGK